MCLTYCLAALLDLLVCADTKRSMQPLERQRSFTDAYPSTQDDSAVRVVMAESSTSA